MKYLLLLLLAGCGYTSKGSELAQKYSTLSIPYVKGDIDGAFTDALVREMGETGQFALVYSGGALRLDAQIITNRIDLIGFQYDSAPTKFNDPKTRLVPNEERREIAVQVTLVDTATNKKIFGPQVVRAHVDYDFVDSDAIQDLVGSTGRSVLAFSLGQLDSLEGARDASYKPLFNLLAKKIALGFSAQEVASE